MHDTPPWHPGIHVAGQCLEWLPTDTRESFDKTMQDTRHKAYFESQGWTQPGAITYKINSAGFRCEEFDSEEPCLVALGCSFTVGIGLPIESVWPSVLGQRLGLRVCNLGWGGVSADTCFRLARYWIPRLKPKIVAMLAPPRSRVELIMDQGGQPPIEVFLPGSESLYLRQDFVNDIFLKHWWLHDENATINSEKNMLAIQHLAVKYNAQFVALRADEEMNRSREEVGYARDLMHAGPRGHELVAQKMLKELTWP